MFRRNFFFILWQIAIESVFYAFKFSKIIMIIKKMPIDFERKTNARSNIPWNFSYPSVSLFINISKRNCLLESAGIYQIVHVHCNDSIQSILMQIKWCNSIRVLHFESALFFRSIIIALFCCAPMNYSTK